MTAAAGDPLGAVYSEARALARHLERDRGPAAGDAVRGRVAAAVRRELEQIRAETQPQPQPTTTTRAGSPPPDPYARRRAPARA